MGKTKTFVMEDLPPAEPKPVVQELEEKAQARVVAISSKPRIGKTRKARMNGALSRNAANKIARGNWSNGTTTVFPTHTCGGKGNSSKPYKRGTKRMRKVRFG